MRVDCLSMEITTHCNKRCPDCCAGVGINRTLQHHSLKYFEHAASLFYGLDRIHITGGEPTIHPQFPQLLKIFRSLFGCSKLTMHTNGARVGKYMDLIVEHLDWVNFSDYEEHRDVIAELSKRMQVNVEHLGPDGALFVPRAFTGGGQPCTRAVWRCGATVYADGKLWGCVTAPGLSNAEGFVPGPDWQDHVMTTPIPCSTCYLSEGPGAWRG